MQPQPFVLNTPLQVAAALRYKNANGDLVTQLYPNDYVSLIGGAVNTVIGQNVATATILGTQNTQITTLQSEVAALLTSATGFVPTVNGYCLYGDNARHPITDVVEASVSLQCDYNDVLGTPTALALSILKECANLNTVAAYSQNSTMSALPGWVTSPATIADAITNIWLGYCDARAGITQALVQSAITCADIIVNYTTFYNPNTKIISFYFYSSSIPTNFSANNTNSGLITITDIDGNTYTKNFDLYAAVLAGSVTANISASSLSPTSSYDTVISYSIVSTTPALGCSGARPGTVLNYTATCPNSTVTSPTNTSVQFSFTPTVFSNVMYTVELFSSSGVTSGSTALQTKTYVNPGSTVTDTFTNLTASSVYIFRISITVGAVTTHCPTVTISTSS